MAQARKIATYVVVIFVLYTIIDQPSGRPISYRWASWGYPTRPRASGSSCTTWPTDRRRTRGRHGAVMIRHLVLFKLNEGVERDEPRVAAGARAFAGLGELVPDLRPGSAAGTSRTGRSRTTSPSTPRSRTPPPWSSMPNTRPTRRWWRSGRNSPPGWSPTTRSDPSRRTVGGPLPRSARTRVPTKPPGVAGGFVALLSRRVRAHGVLPDAPRAPRVSTTRQYAVLATGSHEL